MRRAITAHVAQGGAGLDPLAKQAIGGLKPLAAAHQA